MCTTGRTNPLTVKSGACWPTTSRCGDGYAGERRGSLGGSPVEFSADGAQLASFQLDRPGVVREVTAKHNRLMQNLNNAPCQIIVPIRRDDIVDASSSIKCAQDLLNSGPAFGVIASEVSGDLASFTSSAFHAVANFFLSMAQKSKSVPRNDFTDVSS